MISSLKILVIRVILVIYIKIYPIPYKNLNKIQILTKILEFFV